MMFISRYKVCIQSLMTIAMMMLFGACGPRPLTRHERSVVEKHIPHRATQLIKNKVLPDRAPMTSIELIREIFNAHQLLKGRLPSPLTPGELVAGSIRRPGHGEVGDLIIFKSLPRTLDYAIIFRVLSHTRYQAIGMLLGEVRLIEIDLGNPQSRRDRQGVINTVIRPIEKTDPAPYLYLAGALFSEFRSLF